MGLTSFKIRMCYLGHGLGRDAIFFLSVEILNCYCAMILPL
jgi:hypothetical protein